MLPNPRLAVVTGGTSGIGLAIAHRLAEEGYELILTGRDPGRGASAVHAVEDKHHVPCTFVRHASDDWQGYSDLLAALAGRPVHALVASAAEGLQAHLLDTSREDFEHMLKVNVIAPQVLVKRLRPALAPNAGVILISSDAGVQGEQALGAYSVTKAAVIMMGRMLALDLAAEGVRVNVVCPGDTYPGMRYLLRPGETRRDADDFRSWPLPPKGRIGEAHDTAEMVAFLLSDRADFVLGSVLLVDGGSRAGRPG